MYPFEFQWRYLNSCCVTSGVQSVSFDSREMVFYSECKERLAGTVDIFEHKQECLTLT